MFVFVFVFVEEVDMSAEEIADRLMKMASDYPFRTKCRIYNLERLESDFAHTGGWQRTHGG